MAVIDEQVFAALVDSAGADFMPELIDSFLEDGPQGLAALRAAVAAGDAAAFRRGAHSLKSNGVTFGARAFADTARELEHTPLAELGGTAAARVDALGALFDAVAAALRERRHA
ncbi:Hpt domain-containing protein [Roseateles sp.]|uniref:Hpt domain-containing protein n=1 Tax=Roseateles sp. TaxID=1971397 RepID=UPI0026006AEC|nr:Hpt domain-containing protein [Roseateles sp.]MBV8036443.1 Hpt domain-containing protein [Roseateles sp.]